LQEGFQSFPGAAAKLNQQFAIIEEEAAEDLGDGKDPMSVRDGLEHMPTKSSASAAAISARRSWNAERFWRAACCR